VDGINFVHDSGFLNNLLSELGIMELLRCQKYLKLKIREENLFIMQLGWFC
jgi:hypothetical protein